MEGRSPPHSLDAERAVLGGLFIKPSAFEDVAAMLAVDDFFLPAHREVFTSMLAIRANGGELDTVAVADDLRVRGELGSLDGGAMYLLTLSNAVPTAENIGHYTRLVKTKATLRGLIANCLDIAMRAHGDVNADDLIDEHRAALENMGVGRDGGPDRVGDLLDHAIDYVEKKMENPGGYQVLTGIQRLDDMLGGLRGENVIVVAQRPGQGKSSWTWTTLIRISLRGIPTLIFSLEMGRQEMVERGLSFTSQVEGQNIVRGRLNLDDWKRLHLGAQALRPIPLYMDASAELTLEMICASSRKWVKKRQEEWARTPEGIAALKEDPKAQCQVVIAIDGISHVEPNRPGKSRADDVSKISRQFKKLSKTLKCPIVEVVHLNRESVKSGKARKPNISDLRESGSLEQDADVIMFPFREPGEQGAPVAATMIVGKNRNGETGEVQIAWDKRYMAFYDAQD